MNSEIKCGKTGFERSLCMVQAVLDDIKNTYTSLDNGGISDLKQLATYSYQVKIPRNEAADLITYEFELQKNGSLKISKKTQAVESPGTKR